MEHWLPLLHERMETIFDYVPGSPIVLEPQDEEAAHERLEQINDYYNARVEAQNQPGSGAIYRPLPPDRLYLTQDEWQKRLEAVAVARLSPFAAPEKKGPMVDIAAKQGRNFAAERNEPGRNVFEAVTSTSGASEVKARHRRFWAGSRDRMQHVLTDHALANLRRSPPGRGLSICPSTGWRSRCSNRDRPRPPMPS
jgi:transcription-repair coupling factor (superfamily II helicase)